MIYYIRFNETESIRKWLESGKKTPYYLASELLRPFHWDLTYPWLWCTIRKSLATNRVESKNFA